MGPNDIRRGSIVTRVGDEMIYEYKIFSAPYAPAGEWILNFAIRRESVRRCPDGYRELSREKIGEQFQIGPPAQYYDVLRVRIACPLDS